MEPKLRFKEFSGEWEETTIGNVFTFISTNSLSRNDLNYIEGNIYNVHYGDIHIVYPTITDAQKEVFPYINKEVDLKICPENFCQEGDLLLADASEDYDDIGKSIEIINIGEKSILAGLHTIFMRDLKGVYANKFKGFMMNSNSVKKQIKVLASGAKVLGISKANIVKVKIPVPSLPEQTKIADFLSTVDDKIQNQQDKITHLENIKKGFMQKIFSRKIRFKDDQGNEFPEWEEKKIGNIYLERSERTNKEMELLSVTINNGVLKRTDIEGKDSSSEDKSNYKVVYKGDMVYNSMRMWQGANGVSKYDGIVSPAYTVLTSKIEINNTFFSYLFKIESLIYKFRRFSQGLTSDTWNLKYPQIREIKIEVPCLEEQQKIADFLSSFDEKIDIEKNTLEHLKELKKGLLQQMFV